ncbi:MAG: Ppx/GppA family phosphatase [Pseudomonadota bacterium]
MDGPAERSEENWGPFGRPLFDDPKMSWLKRVGVVDVGSNSIRLVIFDGAARSPAYFYNEKIMAGLGAGLPETGRLNPEGRERALAALTRFQLLAEDFRMPPLAAVATAAVRNAKDGNDFCQEVLEKTGMRLWVIDGKEEARLSAQGILLGWPAATGLMCDIGGSSMELADVSQGDIGSCLTSPLGPLQLQGIESKKERRAHIASTIRDMAKKLGKRRARLYLVGGSWRALARIDMVRRSYPLHVLHEYRMTPDDIRKTLTFFEDQDPAEIGAASSTSSSRMALLPMAAEVLGELVDALRPREIAISSYGLREGMLYQQMPMALRQRDPLIEACLFAEAKDSRHPGFGQVLYRFLEPLFGDVPAERLRLIQAACLLHDVTWRAHPDYRHEACFDYITRASLGGLTHLGRVFIGTALMFRYKNKGPSQRFTDMVALMSDADRNQAEVLGKAMRFGAMLTADLDQGLGTLSVDEKAGLLQVALSERSHGLFGEVAQARFKSLAGSLGLEPSAI